MLVGVGVTVAVALPAVSVLLDYSPNFPTPSAAQRRRSRPASRPAVFGGRRVPPQPRRARLPIPGPTGERAQPHAVHDVVGAEFVRATVSKAGRIRGNESLIALGGSASRRFVRPPPAILARASCRASSGKNSASVRFWPPPQTEAPRAVETGGAPCLSSSCERGGDRRARPPARACPPPPSRWYRITDNHNRVVICSESGGPAAPPSGSMVTARCWLRTHR